MKVIGNLERTVQAGLALFLGCALLASTATPAGADQCARPSGGGCKKKIQAALDAAAPGEQVLVYPGYYRETLTISTQGVKLVGMGAAPQDVVVDGEGSGDVVDIEANGVTVKNVKLANGSSYGIYVDGTNARIVNVRVFGSSSSSVYVADGATGALLMNSSFQGYGATNVYVDADDAQVIGCYLATGDDEGIDAYGDNIRVVDNVVRNCEDDYGIYIEGDGAVVRGNEVNTADSELIYISGNDAVIANNRVHAGSSYGIEVYGDNPLIRDNVVYGSYGYGVAAYGDQMHVINNVSHDITDDYGMDIHCTSCTGGAVQGNLIYNIPDDETGAHITADGPGFVVQGNTMHHVSDTGFDISGSGMKILFNTAYAIGAEGEEAMEISGDNNEIRGNYVHHNNGSGIYVSGDNNVLKGNRALGNTDEGIEISSGDANRLVANTVRDNLGSGIYVGGGATNTVLNRNAGHRNSYLDFENYGSGTVLGTGANANDFGTTGP
jgi:parallel beta-helix repeat protein